MGAETWPIQRECTHSGHQNLLHPRLSILFRARNSMHVVIRVFKEGETIRRLDSECKRLRRSK